jgi:hypothetical protein
MKVFSLRLTDGRGNHAYGVKLIKEASTWEDVSSAGHHIYDLSQGGNVHSSGGGLACKDEPQTPLMLNGANWNMAAGDRGTAQRQKSPTDRVENDWKWLVFDVSG